MINRLQPADIRLLRVFAEVARNRGVTAAAEVMNVGQSTVSTQMKDLESRLGMVLARRGRTGFELTSEGQAIFEALEILERQMGEFISNTAAISNHIHGTVRIGVSDVVARHNSLGRLHEAIRCIEERHSSVQVEVESERVKDLHRGLLSGAFDLAWAGLERRSAELERIHLFDNTAHIYCAGNNPLFHQDDVTIDDEALQLHSSVIYQFDTYQQEPFSVSDSVLTSSSEVSIFYILSGRYIGYLSDAVAEPWLLTGEIRSLAPERYFYVSPGGAIYRKSSLRNRLMRGVIKIIKDMA